MLHIIESKKPFTELARDLENAVPNHKFGVLGVHDLKAKMAEKGVAFAPHANCLWDKRDVIHPEKQWDLTVDDTPGEGEYNLAGREHHHIGRMRGHLDAR